MDQGISSSPRSGSFHLSDELVQFLESGVSIILAVVGLDGRAKAGRAVAVRVAAGSVRVIYPVEGNASITRSAQAGGAIAATFSAPMSHRTIQLKAMSSRAEPIESEDHLCVERQIDAFAEVLRTIGFAPPFVKSFCNNRSASVCVLSFLPEAAFEQTPGPGAGREL